MTTGYLLVVDWLGRPHTANDERKKHWRELSVIHRDWREAGAQAHMLVRPPRMEACFVTAWARYRRPPLTDPDAIAPATKCVLDGLVSKGMLTDDTGVFVHGCLYLPPEVAPGSPDALLVHVTPLAAGTPIIRPS